MVFLKNVNIIHVFLVLGYTKSTLKKRIDQIAGYVKEVLFSGKRIPAKVVFIPKSYDMTMNINDI